MRHGGQAAGGGECSSCPQRLVCSGLKLCCGWRSAVLYAAQLADEKLDAVVKAKWSIPAELPAEYLSGPGPVRAPSHQSSLRVLAIGRFCVFRSFDPGWWHVFTASVWLWLRRRRQPIPPGVRGRTFPAAARRLARSQQRRLPRRQQQGWLRASLRRRAQQRWCRRELWRRMAQRGRGGFWCRWLQQ